MKVVLWGTPSIGLELYILSNKPCFRTEEVAYATSSVGLYSFEDILIDNGICIMR